MAQQKPSFKILDIWANTALEANKAKPPLTKIETGWVYGEKPPHNEFNWWWNLVGKMLVHLQQHGISSWDNETTYQNGALAWYLNQAWKSKVTNNTNNIPQEGEYWSAVLSESDGFSKQTLYYYGGF